MGIVNLFGVCFVIVCKFYFFVKHAVMAGMSESAQVSLE